MADVKSFRLIYARTVAMTQSVVTAGDASSVIVGEATVGDAVCRHTHKARNDKKNDKMEFDSEDLDLLSICIVTQFNSMTPFATLIGIIGCHADLLKASLMQPKNCRLLKQLEGRPQ